MKAKWLEYFDGTRNINDVPRRDSTRVRARAKILFKTREKAKECMEILTLIFQGMYFVTGTSQSADIQFAKILDNDLAEQFLKSFNLTRLRVASYKKLKKERERSIPWELRRSLHPTRDLIKEKREKG